MRCTQHPAARRLAEVYAVSRNRRQGRVSDCLRVIDCSGKEKALPRAARRALRDADRASSSARGGRQLRHLDVHVRAALFVLGWALHELHGWTSVTVAAGDCIPGR